MLDSLASGVMKNDPGWRLLALDDPELAANFVEEEQAEAESTQKKLIAKGVTGVFVVDTRTNSPAAKANLGTYDVVTAMKDTPVETVAEVCDVLQSSSAGEKIPLEGVFSANADGKQSKFGEAWTSDLVLEKGGPTSTPSR
ncbi:PDZ domain-containing protein [Streptomyces avidinii]